MEKKSRSSIPVRIRKDNAKTDVRLLPPSSSPFSLPGLSTAERTDKRRPPSSSCYSSPGPSSTEKLVGKRRLPGLPTSLAGSISAEQPTAGRLLSGPSHPSCAGRHTDKQLLRPGSSFDPLSSSPSSAEWPTEKRIPLSSFNTPLPDPPQFNVAKQPTDSRLRTEQTRVSRMNGRQTGHSFANNVAKDNSRVHNGDNYNETHQYNYQGPNPDDGIPRSLEEAIAEKKVPKYMKHVMEKLSFERMGLRKSTIAPALIDTCQWLLTGPEYMNWRNPDLIHKHHGFMWIKSKAGAGKSTMMKFLLESSRSQHPADNVISFFFNARGDEMEKTLSGLYRHLLHQLLSTVSRLQYSIVDKVNTLASQGWQLQPLKDLFREAVLDLQSERFTCFIDALDESSEDDIRDLVDFFEELGNNIVARDISFQVCFSSRHYPNVKLETCQYLNLDNKREHEDDITLYIKSKLIPRKGGISDDLLALVQKKAQGVFLWVVLVTQMLKKDYDRGDIHEARDRLNNIPPGLHSLFQEMIHRNVEDPNDNKNLLSILQWIAFAQQPLTPQDLYFAVRSEDPNFNISQFWEANDVNLETMELFILNCSKGLAELTRSHQKPTIQFIHESVRDFLNKTGFDILTPGRTVPLLGFAHDNLKRCCLRWITSSLYKQLSRSPFEVYRTPRLRIDEFPLLYYAIENMIEHADLACTNGVSQKDFIETFPVEVWTSLAYCVDHRYTSTRERYGPYNDLRNAQKSLPHSLIEILAYHRVKALLAIELQRTGPRLLSYQYELALRSACGRGAMPILRFLLDNGAPSYNSAQQQTGTLTCAVKARNTAALQLLLSYGKHAVSLHNYAAVVTQAAGYPDVVPLVLGNIRMPMKASTKLKSAIEATFLPACLKGDEAVVVACLEKNANPDAYVKDRPAWHAVSAEGHNRILGMLFDHGADPDVAQGRHYYDALLEALRKGRDDIVHTLALQPTVSLLLQSRCYCWEVMDTLTLRDRGDTIGALLDHVQGFRALNRDVYLESMRLAIARGNNEVVQTFRDRGVTLPEETLPAIKCAPKDAWVNALPASFFARESVPGLSLLHEESVEDEMI